MRTALSAQTAAVTAAQNSLAQSDPNLAKAAAQQFLQARKVELTKATEAAVAGLQQQIDADVAAAQNLYSSIAKAPQDPSFEAPSGAK